MEGRRNRNGIENSSYSEKDDDALSFKELMVGVLGCGATSIGIWSYVAVGD